jgi:hypothetical protein
MWHRNESRLSVLCAGCLWLIAGGASAQNNPELGDVGAQGQVQGQVQTQPQPDPLVQSTWAAGPTPGAPPPAPPGAFRGLGNRFEGTDHGSVVGHFGAGFFGIVAVPVSGIGAMGAPNFADDQLVSAPTLGLRWWMMDWLGLEGAVGVGIESGGTSFENDMTSGTTNERTVVAFAIHGGVPLVIAASKHFAFELVPELNFGFAVGGLDDESMDNADVDLSGYVFELGGRAGAEIQFGFIDIPQLAIQASIGLHLRIENRGHSLGDQDTSNTHVRFGTSVIGEPWDIFQGNLTAIYYF